MAESNSISPSSKSAIPTELLETVKRILAAAETPRDRALIAVLASTGGWISEVINMRIEDIRLGENATVKMVRHGICCDVPLDPIAVKQLIPVIGLRGSGFIFTAERRRGRGMGSVLIEKHGKGEAYYYRWSERSEPPGGKPYYRMKRHLLGYVAEGIIGPRVYKTKQSGHVHWAASWRTGRGKSSLVQSKFFKRATVQTEQEAQAQLDAHLKDRGWTPKYKVLTREEAEMEAAKFMAEKLHKPFEGQPDQPICARTAIEIVNDAAIRARIPNVDIHTFRRSFLPFRPAQPPAARHATTNRIVDERPAGYRILQESTHARQPYFVTDLITYMMTISEHQLGSLALARRNEATNLHRQILVLQEKLRRADTEANIAEWLTKHRETLLEQHTITAGASGVILGEEI